MLPITGFIILGILVYRIGIDNILSTFRDLNCEFLLILPLLITSLFLIQTLKWHLILKYQQVIVPFETLFRLNLLGIFYGAITPGRAGVLLKVRYLADYCEKPMSELGSSVIIDKLLELIVLGGFATIGSVFVAKSFGKTVFVLTASVTMTLVILSFIFYRRATAGYVKRVLAFVLFPLRRQASLAKEVDRFYSKLPNKASLMIPLMLAVCAWLLIWSQTFIIAIALSMSISYGLFISIISIGSLISLIPITINGIGTREAALIAMFSVYGVTPEKTLSMSLISLLLCGYFPALLGAFQIRFFRKIKCDRAIEEENVMRKIAVK